MSEEAKLAYREALVAGAAKVGLKLDPALADQMSLHYGLVLRWAERINLTAVKDPIPAAGLHGIDSLFFAKLIDPDERSRAVDVGSGAGFPGIVVALARPSLRMTLLEPARKKASFLRVALAELGLDQVRVVEERLELGERRAAVGPGKPVWPADLILSRATIPPIALIARAAKKLSPGGRLILTGGSGVPPLETLQRAAGEAGLSHEARHAFVLPAGETRILDVLRESRSLGLGQGTH